MGILAKDPVVIGGSAPQASALHEDITDPPTINNVVSTLLVVEDRENGLTNNRNSDSTHNWKVTVPSTTFSSGYAFYVNFGQQYENAKGEPVAPHVTLDAGSLTNLCYVADITPGGYSVYLPALTATNPPVRLRMSVKQST